MTAKLNGKFLLSTNSWYGNVTTYYERDGQLFCLCNGCNKEKRSVAAWAGPGELSSRSNLGLCYDCLENRRREQVRRSVRLFRQMRAKPKENRPCEHCGSTYTPKRSTARFCSTKCRVYANRKKAG